MTKAWLAPGLLPAYIHCSIDYPFHVYAHWTGQQRPLKGSLMQRLNGHLIMGSWPGVPFFCPLSGSHPIRRLGLG